MAAAGDKWWFHCILRPLCQAGRPPLYTELYSVHCTVYTVQGALYSSVYCRVYTGHCILYSVHWLLDTTLYRVYNHTTIASGRIGNAYGTVYCPYCTLYSVQYTQMFTTLWLHNQGEHLGRLICKNSWHVFAEMENCTTVQTLFFVKL